jgi:hypothetical protein
VQIIVVSFEPNKKHTAVEVVGAATDWHTALLVARQHAQNQLTYDSTVNVHRDTKENRTRFVTGGQYVMTNVSVTLEGEA